MVFEWSNSSDDKLSGRLFKASYVAALGQLWGVWGLIHKGFTEIFGECC